jgi:2-amino-4-hydroxy-6-hydroxymethyldihydropteridine diphosphokinase
MSIVYLSLGSNLGDRIALLEEAVGLIEESIGSVVARSTMRETEPWGYASANRFINACIALNTARSPLDCLSALQSIEKHMGRLKNGKEGYSDRNIDIDILLYDDLVMETSDLVLPHPRLHERLFVLEPMVEIAPNLVHPRFGLTMRSLYEALISTP